jgi:hypothetical protein
VQARAADRLGRAIPRWEGRGDLKGSLTVCCSGARERESRMHLGMARAPTEHGVRRLGDKENERGRSYWEARDHKPRPLPWFRRTAACAVTNIFACGRPAACRRRAGGGAKARRGWRSWAGKLQTAMAKSGLRRSLTTRSSGGREAQFL